MLEAVYIKNYVLVAEGAIHFEPGLNIITGETGAGKSILVGALATLLGERTSATVLPAGESKAYIEGHFAYEKLPAVKKFLQERDLESSDGMLILRREILASGRSRAFVNDTPVTLDDVESLAAMLVDLHGQHEHQSLLRVAEHIEYVDAFASLQAQRHQVAAAYQAAESARAELEALREKQRSLLERRDYLAFQLEEISKVDPQPGEEDELLQEEKRLAHSSELRASCTQLAQALYEQEGSALEVLGQAQRVLTNLQGYDPAFREMHEEITSAVLAVEDVGKSLLRYADRIETNPERLEQVRRRLAAFAHLKKKYSVSFEALLAKRDELQAELDQIATLDNEIAVAEQRWGEEVKRYIEAAKALSALRREAAARLETMVPQQLTEVGMPNCRFQVEMHPEPEPGGWCCIDGEPVRATAAGIDRVEFLLSSNPGQPLRPLAKIASGGEISRIMLILKSLIAGSDRVPVLIFDEIDIGISGRVAQAVGQKLRDLAQSHQILVITHLPQIAGVGDCHFLVEKQQSDSRTTTSIRKLEPEERERAIAQLLAGQEITEAHLASARELLRTDL